jgi:hypothetical protein
LGNSVSIPAEDGGNEIKVITDFNHEKHERHEKTDITIQYLRLIISFEVVLNNYRYI